MNQAQLFTDNELKKFKMWSNILFIASISGMLCSFAVFIISSTMKSSFTRDFLFISIIVFSCGLFFVAQLFEQISMGRQLLRFDESNRKASIRSAVYGITACLVCVIILIIAALVH